MTVSELISKLNQMVSTGEIDPSDEVIISSSGFDADIDQVDWIWSYPEDEDNCEKTLVLEG